jgi:hypothetical protein
VNQPSDAVVPATFETETCSRCGGSGSYSYCQRFGTVCFKCRGRKVVFTKRGAAANAYLIALRSKPAAHVQVGDVVRLPSVTMGGTPCDVWMTVREVQVVPAGPLPAGTSGPVDGYTHETVTIGAGTRSGPVHHGGIPSADLIRVAQTAEQKTATFARALAYQATLTKLGKPRARLCGAAR